MLNYNNLLTVIDNFQSYIDSDKKVCDKQGRLKGMIE